MSKYQSSTAVYKKLLMAVKPYKLIFFLALLGNIFYGLVDASFIKLLQPLINTAFVEKNYTFLKWAPLFILGLVFFRALGSFMANYCMGYVGRRVVMDYRRKMFNHLLKLPTKYFDKVPTGEILAKITYNVEQVAEACTNAVTITIREGFFAFGLILVMFSVNWKLSMMFFILVPIMGYMLNEASKRLRHTSRDIQHSIANVTRVAQEAIEGQKVVKAFGGQAYEAEVFEKATEKNRKEEMRVIRVSAIAVPAIQFVASIALVVTLLLVGLYSDHIFKSVITPGACVTLIGSMLALLQPLKQLTRVNSHIQKGIAGAASIFEFLEEEVEQEKGQKQLVQAKGNLEYKNVNFGYEADNGKITLHHISFSAKAGETIAIVGRSGSGKSTLVSLLPRFYDCEGEILIDGLNINDLSLKELRQQISIVSQQVTLFNDTVLHNIAYGCSDADLNAIIEAAEFAHVMEFVEKLPEGLNTIVGEDGVRLSGGQKQRIAIARAVLKKAPILILDEATSSLDSESEKKIQEALKALIGQSTTLVIAHRLSTIENADRIMVVDKGQIIEMGTHDELMQNNGLYCTLRNMQFQTEVPVPNVA